MSAGREFQVDGAATENVELVFIVDIDYNLFCYCCSLSQYNMMGIHNE